MAAAMEVSSISRRERNINTPVGAFNSSKKHSDQARWICVYPVYLNNKKTLQEGRKLPVKNCVENPTATEIRDVLQHLGFNVALESHRVHPRELNKYEQLYRGRVRVQLKNEDNTPVKPEYPSSKILNPHHMALNHHDLQSLVCLYLVGDAVLKYLGETIPKLKGRGAQSKSTSAAQAQSTNQDQSTQSKKKKK